MLPRDAEEGTYPIEVLVTLADGATEQLTVHYTVDQSAPQIALEVSGEARPGGTVTLRARQVITEADLAGSMSDDAASTSGAGAADTTSTEATTETTTGAGADYAATGERG